MQADKEYPPAPWTLRGSAWVGPCWVQAHKAKPFVPADLEMVCPLPGRTPGGLYLAEYGASSTLSYHELIVVAALARRGRRFGIVVSHIYVDNPASVRGGREIWGLPKQLAQFDRQPGQLIVRQAGRALCSLALRDAPCFPLRLPFPLPAFGGQGEDLRFFVGRCQARPGLARAPWDVPEDSPFHALGLRPARWAVRLGDLQAVIPAPVRPA